MMRLHHMLTVAISWLLLSGSAGAQVCVPYSIPTPGTEVACGSGYEGLKFKVTTKTCPDGRILISSEYDTSQCRPVNAAVDKCAINPASCQTVPTPVGCPSGYQWWVGATRVARCVPNDPPCSGVVVRDANGMPSCVPVVVDTYTEGRAGSCPAGYSGSKYQERTCDKYSDGHAECGAYQLVEDTCVADPVPAPTPTPAPTPPPTPTPTCTDVLQSTSSGACQSGYTGTITTATYKNSCTGALSQSVSNQCVPGIVSDPPACTPSSSTSYSACPSGEKGQIATTTTKSCPSGATSTTVQNQCVPIVCTTTTSTEVQACPTNFTGSITTTYTTNSCTGTTSTTNNTCKPIPPPVSCGGALSEWSSGSHLFCHQGSDMVVAGSPLAKKCGNSGTVLEVDVINRQTGASSFGYACGGGATTLYNMSGGTISLP